MKKLTKLICAGVLALAVAPAAVLVISSAKNPIAANAYSGTGTEESPYVVSTFAELKQVLELNEDSWIVVNSFNNGHAYNLIHGVDYEKSVNPYDCGAINIPTLKNKHLTVNTTIDCRANNLKSSAYLYTFINNRGNLYLSGSGTIAASFNASFANAIIENQGELYIDSPITLDATCRVTDNYGYAIINSTGIMDIRDGTYIGFKSIHEGAYASNQPAVSHESSREQSFISGGTFKTLNENGVTGMGLKVQHELTNIKLKGGTYYGIENHSGNLNIKLSNYLASNCRYTKDGTTFNASGLTNTKEVLTVVNDNLISNVEVSAVTPRQGDHPATPSVSTQNVSIYASEWKDSGDSMVSSFEEFVAGQTYKLQVRLTTTKEFNGKTKVTIGGKEATFKSYDSSYILCYVEFVAAEREISAVQIGLDNPIDGAKVTTPYSYTDSIEINYYEWSPSVDIYPTYVGGSTWKLLMIVKPKEGFTFANNLSIYLNGKKMTITDFSASQVLCSALFPIEKVVTPINNANIDVTTPEVYRTPKAPSTTDDRFTIDSYEWSPNAMFEAGESYTLRVLLKNENSSQTFEGMTGTTINGHAVTIEQATSSYSIISYTFVVATPQYTVSFDANGGSGTMADEAGQFGGYILPAATFTAPANKHFIGWSLTESGETLFAAGYEFDVDDDYTFYAIWEEYQFTKQPVDNAGYTGDDVGPEWNVNFTAVKYEIYEGSSLVDTVTHKWWEHSEASEVSKTYRVRAYYSDTQYIESDEFTLTWAAEIVNVVYCLGEHGSGSNELYYVKKNDSHTLLAFTNTSIIADPGYTFARWEIGDGTGVYKNPGQEITITGDTYIYAIYESSPITGLTAKYNGPSIFAGNSIDPANIYAAINYEDGSNNVLDAEHQLVFYINDQSIDNISTHVFDEVGKIAVKVVSEEQEAIIYVEVKGYTVSFNANGGSGMMNAMADRYGNITLPETASFVAPAGKRFVGWALGSPSGASYDGGASYNVTGDVTFYALWEDKTSDSLLATYNGTIVAGNSLELSKVGITLNYTDNSKDNVEANAATYWLDAEHQITDVSTYKFNEPGNVQIIVKYGGLQTTMLINVTGYTVSFDAGTGSGSMLPLVNKYGNITLPECGFTAPDGKMFDAWSVNGERKLPNQTINVTDDVTVTALWKDIPAETFTVHFEANGGSGTMADVAGQSGDYALPQCGFTAPANKQFKCWLVNGQEKNPGDIIQITADTTVTAQWKDQEVQPEPTYTVSFSANGGSGSMADVTGQSGQYTLPACTFTAPSGKEFAGWKVNGQGELLQPGATINVTANVQLVAQWKDVEQGGGEQQGGEGGGETTPEPEQPAKKKGCKGSILAASALISITSILGAGLLVFKKKEDK